MNRTACFACTTPYQLIGAISIVQNTGLEADLYLLGMFPNYEEIATKLKKYGIFKEVFPVDCNHFKNRSTIKTIWHYLNCRKEVARFLPSTVSYDYYYSSSRQHVKLLLFHELKRRNSGIRCVIYEDGLGAYASWSKVLNTSKNRKIAESILGWDLFSPDSTSIMVTHPELLDLPTELRTIEVLKMPSFQWSDRTREMLLDVFSVNSNDIITEKGIVFEVPRGFYKNGIGIDLEIMDKCIELIVQKLSFDNVICKLHPKSKKKPNVKIKNFEKFGLPVEILYAGMEDLQDRILIGVFSTALFTPKMMFDKEPVVISLHRIVWPSRAEIDPVFMRLGNMYRQKERIFAPHSLSELSDYLQSIDT